MKTTKLENAQKLLDNESLKIKVLSVGNRDEDRLLESDDNDIELLEVEGMGDQINNKARKLLLTMRWRLRTYEPCSWPHYYFFIKFWMIFFFRMHRFWLNFMFINTISPEKGLKLVSLTLPAQARRSGVKVFPLWKTKLEYFHFTETHENHSSVLAILKRLAF